MKLRKPKINKSSIPFVAKRNNVRDQVFAQLKAKLIEAIPETVTRRITKNDIVQFLNWLEAIPAPHPYITHVTKSTLRKEFTEYVMQEEKTRTIYHTTSALLTEEAKNV